MPEFIIEALVWLAPKIATAVVTYFVSQAISKALTKSVAKPSAPPDSQPAAAPPQAGQINIRQALPNRFRSYGRVKVGGPVAFEQTDTVGTGNLWVWVLQGQGLIDAIEEHWIGDVRCGIDGSGNVIQTYDAAGSPLSNSYAGQSVASGFIRIFNNLGTSSQAAPATLVAAFPSIFTSDHRFRGVPNTVIEYKGPANQATALLTFPNGAEPYSAVLRGALLWPISGIGSSTPDGDPDNPPGSWVWSQNAATIICDYMRHPDGFARRASRAMVPSAQFDLIAWDNFETTCNQGVLLKAGGSVARYLLSGSYDLNTAPREVLRSMLECCDGELYRSGAGKIAIRGGEWTVPSLTLTSKDILSHKLAYGNKKYSSCNVINAKFTDPASGYQPTDMDPWRDTANITLRGEEIPLNLDLSWCPNHSQARRIAKIQMAKRNPEWLGTIITGPRGLLAFGERTITLQLPDLGINQSFMVTGFEPAPDLATVRMEISALDSTAYDWDAATEEGTAPVSTF